MAILDYIIPGYKGYRQRDEGRWDRARSKPVSQDGTPDTVPPFRVQPDQRVDRLLELGEVVR